MKMTRKKSFREDDARDNHERWLVSYADFITLLFAFFVVMYAISSVNDGKYEVLSNSLIHAFKSRNTHVGAAQQDVLPPLIKEEARKEQVIKIMEETEIKRIKRREVMRSMAKDVLRALEPLVSNGQVRVTQSNIGVTVEINASVLFSPGEALLSGDSVEALRAVAQVLRNHDHEIQIEGHTDNQPIHTPFFPSNWELSTARASSVIRLFIDNGVNGQRLTAIGYGENRPVGTNDTFEGRMRNRRVTIMILSNEHEKVTEIPVNMH